MAKLIFIADTHHFSEKLLEKDGRAYQLRSGSDQKCLAETGAILDSCFETLKGMECDAVMIAGDVSNDGERASHEEFREKIYELKKTHPVYVITATHDWCCDENPRKFNGEAVYHDVDVLPHEELAEFYDDFGPKDCISKFITHLGTVSYTVDIGDNVRLLALNDDQNGYGGAGFSEEHFQWIEGQIKKAEEDGKIMIGMEHHLLIAHIHPMITGGGTCVMNRDMVATRLADAGLKYMFVGHSHMQAVDKYTTEKGNTITEVNVGSIVGYPAPIVVADVDKNGVHITTEYLKEFTYKGKTYDAKQYLAKHATNLVENIIQCGKTDKYDFADRLAALGIKGKTLDTITKFFFAIKPVLKFIINTDTARAFKILSRMHLIDKALKADFEQYADKKITDYIDEIMLALWDGQINRVEEGSAYYNIVMSVISIPQKFTKAKFAIDAHDAVKAILLGNEYNINDCMI